MYIILLDAADKYQRKGENLCLDNRQQAGIEECALEGSNIFKLQVAD